MLFIRAFQPSLDLAPHINAEIWKKFHAYAILQRAEANLWTTEQYEDWEPCDEVQ